MQSLPANFVLPENMSLTNMFKTIGNGVPYLASKALAQNILDFLATGKGKFCGASSSDRCLMSTRIPTEI